MLGAKELILTVKLLGAKALLLALSVQLIFQMYGPSAILFTVILDHVPFATEVIEEFCTKEPVKLVYNLQI
jgi:hypothetical protein